MIIREMTVSRGQRRIIREYCAYLRMIYEHNTRYSPQEVMNFDEWLQSKLTLSPTSDIANVWAYYDKPLDIIAKLRLLSKEVNEIVNEHIASHRDLDLTRPA